MAENNIGPKRMVTGAHYGLRDWLAQRVTAIAMAIYTVVLLILFLTAGSFSYEAWAGLFAMTWFKLMTFSVLVALFYHAWVGIRDVWMDYMTHNVALRLFFQVATILWLVACVGWTAQILWRV